MQLQLGRLYACSCAISLSGLRLAVCLMASQQWTCMQAVMGTLVKRFLAKQLGLDPAQIYHCAVMPCYDKKLEGSRDDFMVPGKSAAYSGPHRRVSTAFSSPEKASMLFLCT